MKKRRTLYVIDYCLTPKEHIVNAAILCEKDEILAIGGESAFERDASVDVIDLKNTYALPGFIDTHIHGAGGFDSNNICNECDSPIDKMTLALASHGVTSFLPTIVSDTPEKMLTSVATIAEICKRGYSAGAKIAGMHLEGPFIAPKKRGSQKQDNIMKIDMGFARELVRAGEGFIKIMTFAPELDSACDLVNLMMAHDINPSMGHSLAMEEDVIRAIDAGARRCTHLYNGMPALHQRLSSLTTIALTDDRIAVEMILDGFHLNQRMVTLACRAKPKNKIIGVSDAIQATDLNDGIYHLGESEINVQDGLSTDEHGVIAGSTLTLEKGWGYLNTFSPLPKTDISACFSINPAKDIGLSNTGELQPGKKADITFFDKETNKVALTVIDGKIVYNHEDHTQMLKRIVNRNEI